MTFLRIAKACMAVSVILVLASIWLLFRPGPNLSIEFTGGTLMELSVPGKTADETLAAVKAFKGTEGSTIAVTKTNTYFVRTPTLDNEQHQQFISSIQKSLGSVQELQYTTIGPTVGASLKKSSVWALLAASVAIVLYVAAAFRKIPRSLSPWKFGVAAIVAVIHDVFITLGIFTILSHTTSFQMDTLFVSALLSIMGYSVSDTIVIFDRIRDNVRSGEGQRMPFAQVAVESLRQSLSRTLNTGLGALIMLFALFFFGSESIRWFMLALIIGTVVGTYSSFFIATPFVIFWKSKK